MIAEILLIAKDTEDYYGCRYGDGDYGNSKGNGMGTPVEREHFLEWGYWNVVNSIKAIKPKLDKWQKGPQLYD